MIDMDKCLTALESVVGRAEQQTPLHQPEFSGNEWAYVKECLDTGWVSSVGAYVDRFEQGLVEYTGVPYAIAVVNGTCALHIALVLANVKAEDEVLIPSLTFVATANAVAYCGAIPHFIDSSLENLGIDIEKLQQYLKDHTLIQNNHCVNKLTGRIIKAIVPVHIFGHPVDMYALQALCEQYHLTIIEDATESLGSYYHDKHTGHFGKMAVISFNGNKIVTTGGGGAILTDDSYLAKRAKHLTTTAKLAHAYDFYHDEVGYNYRLPNLNAALGCAQLEQLPRFVELKRNLAKKYLEAFKHVECASILEEAKYAKGNYWLNAMILKQPDRQFIEQFIQEAQKKNWGLRGLWTPLNRLPMYAQCPKMDLANTDRLYDSVVSLPSSAYLGKHHG